jgi:TonB family protein
MDDQPMKNRIAVALFVLVPMLMLAPSHVPAQETSEGSRKVVTKVVPQYPSLARSMRLQGVVRAQVLVAPNGTVKLIEVKGGHPVLVDSAQHALREWKWEPAPRETRESVELRFNP